MKTKPYPIQCKLYSCGNRGEAYYCYMGHEENHCPHIKAKIDKWVKEEKKRMDLEDLIKKTRELGGL
jgi:hypothetical protein